jgi:hypothetical protein
MIANKKKFSSGAVLLAGFAGVLILLFSPVFKGQNGLNFLDSLYNSISKDSANYFPEVREKVAPFAGTLIEVTLEPADAGEASRTGALFEKAGARVRHTGKQITVRGSLGRILGNCVSDTQDLYNNDGEAIRARYAMDERLVVYTWYQALQRLSRELNRQGDFRAAKVVDLVIQKAVELSYNYYRIEPLKISRGAGVVTFSLIFYVIYTLWFGFAVLFLFEGWGLKLEH